MSLSNNIKYLRQAAGHTQEELSQALSFERSTISGYELGKRQPDGTIIKKIAKLYHVSVDSLMNKDYEQLCFSPPVSDIPATGKPSDQLTDESPFGVEHTGKIPLPSENQIKKKINEIYRQLDYDDKLLFIQLGLRLLSHPKYHQSEED